MGPSCGGRGQPDKDNRCRNGGGSARGDVVAVAADRGELDRVGRGAADERAVDVGLGHQLGDVAGLDRAAVLHADALSWEPFVRGIAHRCAELSHDLSNNNLLLRNEAAFYATFRHFYDLYHRTFNLERRTLRPWQELVSNISEAPVREIDFQDAEELGFAAGYLVRRFANQYYAATNQKDYLQHRVMTFGSDLKPETIYLRALGKLREYAPRVGAHLSEDFEQRVAVWLSSYPRMKVKVNKQPNEFMAAFWAGYMLGRVK